MPLREMKWRESRGVLNFGAQGSKAASGLNPGTRLAASPRDRELRPGLGERLMVWEEDGCLGFRITANHHGIKMFTGRGGISSERMILMLLFLPRELALDFLSVME